MTIYIYKFLINTFSNVVYDTPTTCILINIIFDHFLCKIWFPAEGSIRNLTVNKLCGGREGGYIDGPITCTSKSSAFSEFSLHLFFVVLRFGPPNNVEIMLYKSI